MGLPQANPGDTAWVLTATALVLFMTLPGLAMFYAGLVRVKNTLSVMMHCVAVACLISVLWLAFGYSLVFDGAGPWIGGLGKAFLLSMNRGALTGSIPEPAYFMFQTTFAVITPALIVGAYVERIKFGAVLLFSGLWLLVVYAPVAHWVWGGGWLAQHHVMDFAGGLVVHATAGVSALVAAVMIGPRDGFPRDLHPPHNPGMTMIGAGMLWVGWYGFNGGSALAANGDAAMALLVTHISASTAGLVWALLERLRFGRSSMVGMVTGVVAGLATITPASGYVGPLGGLALGALGSLVCFFAVDVVKHRFKVDDLLDASSPSMAWAASWAASWWRSGPTRRSAAAATRPAWTWRGRPASRCSAWPAWPPGRRWPASPSSGRSGGSSACALARPRSTTAWISPTTASAPTRLDGPERAQTRP